MTYAAAWEAKALDNSTWRSHKDTGAGGAFRSDPGQAAM